jgi:hypothetical protein
MDFSIGDVVTAQSKGLTWTQVSTGGGGLFKAGDMLRSLPRDLQDSVCHAIKVTGARDTSDIIQFWKERTKNPNGTIPLNLVNNKSQIMNHYFRMINSAGRVPERGSLLLQKLVKKQTSIAKKELKKQLYEKKNSGSREYSDAEIDGMAHLTTSKCVLAGLTSDLKTTATPRAGYFTMKDVDLARKAATTLKWSAALVIGAALIGYVIYPWYRKMRGEARETIEKFDDLTKQPGIHEVMNKIEMSSGNFKPNRTNAPRFTKYSPVKKHASPPLKVPAPSPFKYKKPKKPFFRFIHPDDLKKEQDAEKRNEAREAAAYAKRHGLSVAAVRNPAAAARGHVSCPRGKILNPKTNKCVLKTGAIGQSLLGTAARPAAQKLAAKKKPALRRRRNYNENDDEDEYNFDNES